MSMSDWKPMKKAPHDGRSILALYDNNLTYEAVVVRWAPVTVRIGDQNITYEWELCKGDNNFPDDRLAYWMPITLPDEPTDPHEP